MVNNAVKCAQSFILPRRDLVKCAIVCQNVNKVFPFIHFFFEMDDRSTTDVKKNFWPLFNPLKMVMKGLLNTQFLLQNLNCNAMLEYNN